jgi:hypothetical protein
MRGPDRIGETTSGFSKGARRVLPSGRSSAIRADLRAQIAAEKVGQLVERDQVHAVVEIDMAGVRHDLELLRLASALVGVLAEFLRVRLVTRDEEHRPRRDRLDIIERVEVHEPDGAAQRRLRGEIRPLAFRAYRHPASPDRSRKTHARSGTNSRRACRPCRGCTASHRLRARQALWASSVGRSMPGMGAKQTWDPRISNSWGALHKRQSSARGPQRRGPTTPPA